MDRLRRLSFGEAAKIAAVWPLVFLGLGAVLYMVFWIWLCALELRYGPTSSGDLQVTILSWPEAVAILFLPPMAFVLVWAVLRVANRAS